MRYAQRQADPAARSAAETAGSGGGDQGVAGAAYSVISARVES